MIYYKWFGLFERNEETHPCTMKMRVRLKRYAETSVREKVNDMKCRGWTLSVDSGLIRCDKHWRPI